MNRSPGSHQVSPKPRDVSGQALTIHGRRTGRVVCLKLGGELDAHSSDLLGLSMRAEEQEGCDEITLDLEGLVFIDSTGLRILIEAASRAQGGGWSIRVINARGKVRRVFDLTDMDSLLVYCQKTALRAEY